MRQGIDDREGSLDPETLKGGVESGAMEVEAAEGWRLGEGRMDSGAKGRGKETIGTCAVKGNWEQAEVGKERDGSRWKQGLADRDRSEGVFK